MSFEYRRKLLIGLLLCAIQTGDTFAHSYTNVTTSRIKRETSNCGRLEFSVAEEYSYCYENAQKVYCPHSSKTGTVIQKQCNNYYKSNGLPRTTYVCDDDGKWSQPDGSCQPVCGMKNSGATPLIVGGEESEKYEYPWVVAVYTKDNKLCGGTLISPYHVVSVAHCFVKVDGTIINISEYTIRAGKHYRDIDELEWSAQSRKIAKLMVHEDHRGNDTRNNFDIALIEVSEHFVFTPQIRPICVDWDSLHETTDLKNGNRGTVAGWGFIGEDGPRSEVLREINLPYREYNTCWNRLPPSFAKKFLSQDKFCAGYISKNTGICIGDAGVGFFFKSDGKRYFIRGIASTMMMSAKGCESNRYALYTRVSNYLDWLKNHIKKMKYFSMIFRTKTDVALVSKVGQGCILPQQIYTGRYKLANGNEYNEGVLVKSATFMYLTCSVSNKEMSFYCIENKWIPSLENNTCQQPGTCQSPKSTESETFICKRNHKVISCEEPKNNTVAKMRCNDYYLTSDRRPNHRCINEQWSPPLGFCIPECGKKMVAATTLIIQGSVATEYEYPWVIAVYDIKKDYICSGTIISRHYVLSAAHCFTNKKGVAENKDDYTLMAGKYYRDFNKFENAAQQKKIQQLYVHEEYKASTRQFRDDIALILIDSKFTLSQEVQPICIDWSNNYEDFDFSDGKTAVVAGWGYTDSNGNPSEVLKKLIVPFISKSECARRLPEDFGEKYLSRDKICAGYNDSGEGICSGDSGAGLHFKTEGKYYIRGIASITRRAKASGCVPNTYALYTKVSEYLIWIESITQKQL